MLHDIFILIILITLLLNSTLDFYYVINFQKFPYAFYNNLFLLLSYLKYLLLIDFFLSLSTFKFLLNFYHQIIFLIFFWFDSINFINFHFPIFFMSKIIKNHFIIFLKLPFLIIDFNFINILYLDYFFILKVHLLNY